MSYSLITSLPVMATTQNTYTGDGVTTDYSFTFTYLQESDVKVYLDGTLTSDFYFASPALIRFNSPPNYDTEIVIRRETHVDQLDAVFYPGSSIRTGPSRCSGFKRHSYRTRRQDSITFLNTRMPIQHVIYTRQNLQRALNALGQGDEENVERFIKRALSEVRQIRPKDV